MPPVLGKGEKGSNTQWQCRECGMPLCQKSRTDSFRLQTFLEEHQCSTIPELACLGKFEPGNFPERLKKIANTRSKGRAVTPPSFGATKKKKFRRS